MIPNKRVQCAINIKFKAMKRSSIYTNPSKHAKATCGLFISYEYDEYYSDFENVFTFSKKLKERKKNQLICQIFLHVNCYRCKIEWQTGNGVLREKRIRWAITHSMWMLQWNSKRVNQYKTCSRKHWTTTSTAASEEGQNDTELRIKKHNENER